MIRISIDDSLAEPREWAGVGSVGELVNAILIDLPPDRIVTSLSIDGRTIARQQTSPALKERLDNIKELQIRTADAQVWANQGLDKSISDVERLQKSLLLAAELFRDERQTEGHRIFLHCVEGLERFLDTLVLTRVAMKLDFQRLEVDGISAARLETDLSNTLLGVVACQEQEDFQGVADKIEYELLPNFASWMRLLSQLRLSRRSNA